MNRYVLKFGGSSVETIEKMKLVARRIIERINDNTELVVVVSAMGKSTNRLYDEARKITLLPNKRELDLLLSTGELTSISLLSIILNDLGYKAISLTGEQARIYTTGEFQSAKIERINPEVIIKHLKEKKIVVVAGYQGVNEFGEVTTLGREGSDTSAVTLAHYLNCPCEIYSDVDGVYEVDPRILNNTNKHEYLSYNDLFLLSYHGAKVIATSAIEYASLNKVPLYLASTFNEELKGTIICDNQVNKDFLGIVVQPNIRILNLINGLPLNTLSKFHDYGFKIDVFSNNLIAIASDDIILLEEVINNELEEDEYEEEYVDYNLAKVSIIGNLFTEYLNCNKILDDLNDDLVNVALTMHNNNRFSIFINVDDTLQSVRKIMNTIKGKIINEK